MRLSRHLLPRLLAAVLLLSGLLASAARTFQATSVVILVIDGPRQSELWGDPSRANIPHLDRELRPLGVLLPGFRNNGPTYTTSGHTAIATGIYEDLDNTVGSQLPSHAGLFQHFLEASGLPAEKAWVITSKDKLAILGDTAQPGWQGRHQPQRWCGAGGTGPGYADDAETMRKVKQVLATWHPRLMLINLKQPDAAGHAGVWTEYLAALRASDAHAAELWNALQADPQYRDRTAFFVTHDHGRHLDGIADGFRNHGDGCPGCRAVALLALGPDFRAGTVVPAGGELVDLPVTVAAILGFPLPDARGRVLTELFR